MATIRKMQAGARAKSIGSAFEHLILSSGSRDGVAIIRIPNGCETRRCRGPRGPTTKLVRVHSPFDFCAFHLGRTVVFDAKTVESGRFVYSAITPHQLHYLTQCGRHVAAAGYLVWYRDEDAVIWHSHRRLLALKPRESLGISDGLHLGSGGSMSLLTLMASRLEP